MAGRLAFGDFYPLEVFLEEDRRFPHAAWGVGFCIRQQEMFQYKRTDLLLTKHCLHAGRLEVFKGNRWLRQKTSYTGMHPCCNTTEAIHAAEWFSSWVLGTLKRSREQKQLLKDKEKRGGRGKRWKHKWHLRLCFHLVANFKTKPEDPILSGDCNRKPPPVDFLCFEVTKCPAGDCSLECHGVHTNDGLSLLQSDFYSSLHTWTQKHFFSVMIMMFTETKGSLLCIAPLQ